MRIAIDPHRMQHSTGDPAVAALWRLRRCAAQLREGPSPEHVLAAARSDAERYIEGFDAGRESDTSEAIEGYRLFTRYVEVMLADGDLRRQWTSGVDVEPELRRRVPSLHGELPDPGALEPLLANPVGDDS